MGTMSSRAGTVTVRPSSFFMAVCGITDVCPNLPLQQPTDHQIQIRGEIWLACVRGRSVCAHHKKATARKQLKVPAHELTKAPIDPVPGHRGADRPADHESYPGRFAVMDPVGPHQQVTHHARPSRTSSGTNGERELRAV